MSKSISNKCTLYQSSSSKIRDSSSSDFGDLESYSHYSKLKQKSLKLSMSISKFHRSEKQLLYATTLLKTSKETHQAPSRIQNPQRSFFKIDESMPSTSKQTSVHDFLNLSTKLIACFYGKNIIPEVPDVVMDFNEGYQNSVRQTLKSKEFKNKYHKPLNEHLNTVYYCAPSLKNKGFAEIEAQILTQWRDNPVLHFLRGKWYHTIQKYFESFGDSAPKFLRDIVLEDFKEFIAQLTYVAFRAYFELFEKDRKRGREWVLQKLTTETAVYIITQGSSWAKVYNHIIFPIILKTEKPISIRDVQYELRFGEKLEELEKHLVCLEDPFPKTMECIRRFGQIREMKKKTAAVIQIRQKLEQQLIEHQKYLIQEGKLKNLVILDKDDFISSLIFSLLKSELNLIYELELSLIEFDLVMGRHRDLLLSVKKCGSYYADLESAVSHIRHELSHKSYHEE